MRLPESCHRKITSGTGSTVTGPDEPFWWSEKHNTYVSIEPLLKPFEEVGADAVKKVGWVIIGAMTGPGSKFRQPQTGMGAGNRK